jgi:hypothetical protein
MELTGFIKMFFFQFLACQPCSSCQKEPLRPGDLARDPKKEEQPMHIPSGHQANLSFSSEPGKQWELWSDPDDMWHEAEEEFVIEEAKKLDKKHTKNNTGL